MSNVNFMYPPTVPRRICASHMAALLLQSLLDNQNVSLSGISTKKIIEAFKHVRPAEPLINYPNSSVTAKFKVEGGGTIWRSSQSSACQLTPVIILIP